MSKKLPKFPKTITDRSHISPHNYRIEVNVELVIEIRPKYFGILKIAGLSSLVLLTFLFMDFQTNKLTIIVLVIVLIASLILSRFNSEIISLGKMTFSKEGVKVISESETKFYSVQMLAESKIIADSYVGATFWANIFYMDIDGVNNYLLPNREKNQRYRFKLIGKEHMERLQNIIEGWKMLHPEIKLNPIFDFT